MSSTKAKAAAEAAAATIEHVAHTTEEVSAKGFDKTLLAMKEGMEKATKGIETSQMKMKESVEKAMKTAEEMMAFGQGNIEALMKSTQIYASGFQDISKHLAATSKASLEESVAFTKSLMGVKSVKEAVDLQSGFTKSSIEKAVAETSKLTDASVKLAEQAMAPLTARMSLAVETFGKTH
jgi:phasin family protein